MIFIEQTDERQIPTWEQINWQQVECNVRRLQERIYRATERQEWPKVRSLQKLLTRATSNKLLATRRVTPENRGKHTSVTTTRQALILETLLDLVETVADRPRRILFKGVSEAYEAFEQRAAAAGRPWSVRISRKGEDVVGARNDATLETLVVFYRDEVQEKESLNAFRQFNEDTIAEALLRAATSGTKRLEAYTTSELAALRELLRSVYPSVERLAEFLLVKKARVGQALPLLGLFADPRLSYDNMRQWTARTNENYQLAVLRWQEFLDKGQRNKEAREILNKRQDLLRQAEINPSLKTEILKAVTYDEALQVVNPPNRLVLDLMNAGLPRTLAEKTIADLKSRKLKFEQLPPGFASIPELLRKKLKDITDKADTRNGADPGEDNKPQRVKFCLEGFLRLAGEQAPFPRTFYLPRYDTKDNTEVELQLTEQGRLQLSLEAEAARTLSLAGGFSELVFKIAGPGEDGSRQDLFFFLSGKSSPATGVLHGNLARRGLLAGSSGVGG